MRSSLYTRLQAAESSHTKKLKFILFIGLRSFLPQATQNFLSLFSTENPTLAPLIYFNYHYFFECQTVIFLLFNLNFKSSCSLKFYFDLQLCAFPRLVFKISPQRNHLRLVSAHFHTHGSSPTPLSLLRLSPLCLCSHPLFQSLLSAFHQSEAPIHGRSRKSQTFL